MIHIAIQEALNGKPVDWMEKVSDEQYQLGADRRLKLGVRSRQLGAAETSNTQHPTPNVERRTQRGAHCGERSAGSWLKC
jgi:hypothetical protein